MSAGYRLSVAANLLLLTVVGSQLWHRQTSAERVETPLPRVAAPAEAVEAPKSRVAPPAAVPKPAAVTPPTVAELERMGIPRDVVVNALLDGLNHRTELKLRALQKRYAPGPVPEREYRLLSRESDDEQASELKAALGPDGYRAWDKDQRLRELNHGNGANVSLSPDEAERAYQLQKAFDDKNRELQMAMEDGVADMADVNALQAQAKQQLDQQLQNLLGADRFNQLQGNADPTADVMRRYGNLNPTPEQAQAIVQADAAYRDQQAALAKQLSANPADAAAVAAQLKALQDAHDASVRQALGADAYDQAQQQHDPTFQALQQYAGAWNLNDSQVQSVYQALHAFQDQAQRLRQAADMSEAAGQPVDRHQIETSIQQAQQQVQASLATQVGAELANRLGQNGLLDPGGPHLRR